MTAKLSVLFSVFIISDECNLSEEVNIAFSVLERATSTPVTAHCSEGGECATHRLGADQIKASAKSGNANVIY